MGCEWPDPAHRRRLITDYVLEIDWRIAYAKQKVSFWLILFTCTDATSGLSGKKLLGLSKTVNMV